MRFQRGVDGEVQHAGRLCSDQGLRGTTVLAEAFCGTVRVVYWY